MSDNPGQSTDPVWNGEGWQLSLADGTEVMIHPPGSPYNDDLILWELELLMGGNVSVTIEGNLDDEANYWMVDRAEWWLHRRSPIYVDGGLPVAKMQSYDVAEVAVRTVRAHRATIEAGPPSE